MKKRYIYHLMLGFSLLGLFCPKIQLVSTKILSTPKWSSQFRPYGAYVDEVKFIIFNENEISLAMLALENGDIDAYDEQVPEEYLATFARDPNIELTFTSSIRYRALTVNCDRFPTNITAFRRAMAFGYDKYRANMECIGGIGLPQDSLFPICATEWEVESEMAEHFYEADYVSGNKSLENAGFIDLDGDGWREYDQNRNGIWDPGVDLEHYDYEVSLHGVARNALKILEDGLEQMGIKAEDYTQVFTNPPTPSSWYSVRSWTEGVSMINTPEFLYDNFRTDAKWNSYYQFSNSTIDTILDQMVISTDLNEVKAFAREANTLLTFEQPQIICYNYPIICVYRTDRFDGWFDFLGAGIANGENLVCVTKLHLKDSLGGPYGGTFYYCLSDTLGTFNPYLQRTRYEETVFQYIYERLWNIDPYTWDPIPGLAYDWEIEQTVANGEVRDGQKFTFYLYENETWHDGEPFTAADVNHSLHLWRNSPYSEPNMANVYKIETPNGPEGHTIELYINETGYFEWVDTTRFYITPEHIWRDVTNISAFTPTNDQIIGTGPYMWNEYVPGEYISLLRHEDWRWDIRDIDNHVENYHTSSFGSTQSSIPMTTIQSSRIENTSGFTLVMLFGALLGVHLVIRPKRKGR
ncbi:MAG: hypothetical protein JSW11_18660, partial [Candidatus Heimdallarchaeota archaeon]